MSEPYDAPPDAEAYGAPPPTYVQLTQQRVPLRRAAEVFSTADDAGRYPIIVLVKQGGRFSVQLLLVAAGIAALVVALPLPPLVTVGGLVGAVALLFAGSARAVLVPIPEGTQAILAERGRFLRVAGPGIQRVPPTVVVTHIVTTRDIPFGTYVPGVPLADEVRVDVELLFTFRIADPAKFVYNTTAPDFDAVCLGVSHAVVRQVARTIRSDQVLEIQLTESEPLRAALGPPLERYGVEVTRVFLSRVDLPPDFMAAREARRLAVLRTSQQEEQAGLDRRVQADRDALARQEAQARFEREREKAELAAAIRRREIELEAEAEALRIAKLAERLAAHPEAMRWDWAGERLRVARKLAGNSRAIVQVGRSGDVADALVAGAAVDVGREDGSRPRLPDAPDAEAGATGTSAAS